MEELKACVCESQSVKYSIDFGVHLVSCECGINTGFRNTKQEAITAWQNRPREEELQKQVDELEKTIESNNKATRIIYDKSEKREAELESKIELLNESLDLKEAVYASLLADYMALKDKLSHWKAVLG